MLWITAAWGACFVAVSAGLAYAPVLWFAALRSLLAGAVLLLVCLVQRRPVPRSLRSWRLIVVLGLVNVTAAFGAMFAGIDRGSAGVAAVLANAQPLLIVLPAWLLLHQVLTRRAVAALLVGFAGLVVVSGPGGGGGGAVLSLLSAAAITAGTLLVRWLDDVDVIVFTAVHFLVGGLALVAVAAAVEGAPAIRWTLTFVLVLLFLAVVGTAAASLAWFVEAQRCDLTALAAWTFLAPVFGMGFAVVLQGERPSWVQWTGLALVLLATWTALRVPDPSEDRPPTHREAERPGREGPVPLGRGPRHPGP